MNAHTKIQLLPDTEKLGRFCAALFKHANPLGIVSLRAFPDVAKDAPPLFIDPISVGDPQFLAVVTERARQAANWNQPAVFCPPVVTFRKSESAKAENVLEGVALSVDCDEAPNAALALLREILGDPTAIVASGGEWENPETGEVERKVHIHWRLKVPTAAPADHERLREARDLAAKLVGSDATAIALVHPLRWPGSWHRKKNPPRLADIVFESENEIDLTEALELLRDATGGASFDRFPSIVPGRTAGTGLFAVAILRAANVDDVVSALAVIPNERLEWSDWNYVGLATWGATGGSDEGFTAFAEWSAKSSKNDPETTRLRWEHYKTSPPNRIGFGTLVYLARRHNPLWTTGTQPAQQNADPVDLWAKFDPLFDDCAQAYRQELERKHLELCQSFETINRKLAAHIGKYNGIFARLCIIWHCVESERGQLPALISERTARRVGAFLHGFLLPHALAFYAGVLGLSNAHDRLTAVAGYILAHRLDRITNRDVQHGNRTMRGLDRRDIESVFDQLEALGWVDRIPGPKPTAPPHCIVNPAVHVKFAARAAAEAERRTRDRKMIAEILGQRAAPQ